MRGAPFLLLAALVGFGVAAPCRVDVVVGFFGEDLLGFYRAADDACHQSAIACRVFAYVTELKPGRARVHAKKRHVSLGMEAYRRAAAQAKGDAPLRVGSVRHPELPFEQRPLNEASAFLTHIIRRYSDLPQGARLVFVHPHYEGSWHADALPSLMRRACAATNLAFTNLNRPWPLRCMDANGTSGVSDMFRSPELVRSSWALWTGDREVPATIAYECCAQFTTSPSAVRNRTLRSWITYYDAAREGVPPGPTLWHRMTRPFSTLPSKNSFYEHFWGALLAPETRTCEELSNTSRDR